MSMKNWSTTAASNATVDSISFAEGQPPSSLNDSARALMADVRYDLAAQDTIASATTTDLGTKDAGSLTISGTTTITGFGTVSAGIRKLITFSGALTLTHNATSLILPGAANITTVAGDSCVAESLGSGNWKVHSYQAATVTGSGATVRAVSPTFTGTASAAGIAASGEIRGGGAASGSGIGQAFGGSFDGGASSGYGLMASGSVQAVHPLYVWNKATSGDNAFVQFTTEASPAGRGAITYNRAGGLVAYGTTSDYRLKDIYDIYADPGALIDAVPVHLGKMKGATLQRPMFVAHELQEHAPWAVTGEKDALSDGGLPAYQQVDHQILVPLLWSEVQCLRRRLAELEAK